MLLQSFYLHAQKKVEILTETFSKMEDAYREVCLMFSESPKTVEPSEFFGMFQKFVRAWKVVTLHSTIHRHKHLV